ncbi:MAG: hypothetical protein QOK42_1297 [Frankiaceae bacterium]|nr:hypothetical protein [Frankiaceae bacterium]
MRRVLVTTALTALALVAAPSFASAATYSSTGALCTKVGTSGADRIYGTTHRDVICGLGGNDLIYAYGGDDLVDAGSGNDTVYAATGNDVVYAGTGNDVVSGDVGADTIYGSDGADRISGGSGADKESGGAGGDILRGGDDNDRLLGQDGNDDLAGDNGSDTVDGGAGTNWCTIGSTDTQKACVYDQSAPVLKDSEVTPDPVDVTTGDRLLLARLHLVDDTGVSTVQIGFQDFTTGELGPSGGNPHLVSGTVRDGMWEATVKAHRYSEPGVFEMYVDARDRVGRWLNTMVDSAITVRDATPDRSNAVVQSVHLLSSTVDARSADTSIGATAHITDDASGAEVGDVFMCLYSPGSAGAYNQQPCDNMERYSGTARDGSWRSTSSIPKGSVGGTWNVGIWVTDQVHQGSPTYFLGEDVYRAYTADSPAPEPSYVSLANARFTVLGDADNTSASLLGFKADVTSVDTLTAAKTVTLSVQAHDAAGEGVSGVGGTIAAESNDASSPSFPPADGVRFQGTLTDGWWSLTFTFPQGTPPGRYPVSQIWVSDKSHWQSYAPPASPYAGYPDQLAFPPGSIRTADGGQWDGVITVVDSSSSTPS